MTDLWWCETHNQLHPGEMQDQAVTVECRMVRLTAHHQDGRLIGLLAWDRCTDCDGEGALHNEVAHQMSGHCADDCEECPSCRDGWVPRAIGGISPLRGVVIPLEDTDD